MARKTFFEKIGEAKAALDAAKDRYDTLCAIAREELALGAHEGDGVTVSLQVNRTWNKKKALESFGDVICTPQVDQKKARDVMTGAEYESFYVEGAPKVLVKFDD